MNDRNDTIEYLKYLRDRAVISGSTITEPSDLIVRLCDEVLELLKEQEPRVLTLEEFKAHRLGISLKERLPLWTEWKKDKRKNRYTRFGVDTDAYDTEWRCWSAKPTEKQMEATPWQD